MRWAATGASTTGDTFAATWHSVASPLRIALAELGGRADEELIPRLRAALSLDAELIQRLIGAQRLRYVGDAGPEPTLAELRQTSAAVLSGAVDRAGARGAVVGLSGLFGLPADAALSLVSRMHLAQRLMVVWGHALDGDEGELLLRRLLAAARGEAAQKEGLVSTRLRDLLPTAPTAAPASGPAELLRQAAGAALRTSLQRAVQGQLARAVPGLGALTGGRAARADLQQEGERMISVLEKIFGVSASEDLAPLEAEELTEPRA